MEHVRSIVTGRAALSQYHDLSEEDMRALLRRDVTLPRGTVVKAERELEYASRNPSYLLRCKRSASNARMILSRTTWTPESNHLFPSWVRDAVRTTMLFARLRGCSMSMVPLDIWVECILPVMAR